MARLHREILLHAGAAVEETVHHLEYHDRISNAPNLPLSGREYLILRGVGVLASEPVQLPSRPSADEPITL